MTRQENQAPGTSVPEARINLHVQPGARRNEVVGLAVGVLRVRVTAPAQGGKANKALVELLADLLGVSRGRIRILRGHTSRDKVISVEGLDKEEALRRLLSV
ncbi:DUF167 domain-containing protein [Chloroflexota bacterium]